MRLPQVLLRKFVSKFNNHPPETLQPPDERKLQFAERKAKPRNIQINDASYPCIRVALRKVPNRNGIKTCTCRTQRGAEIASSFIVIRAMKKELVCHDLVHFNSILGSHCIDTCVGKSESTLLMQAGSFG